MKLNYIFSIFTLCILLAAQQNVMAQLDKNIEDFSREEVLNLPYNQLLELELSQLMKLAEIAGVSLDELYEIVLNKDVEIASKSAEQIFESPLSTSVITSEEILQSGARNIAEALRLVPGFIIREKTSGNFDVQIRGNDNIPPGNLMLFSENRSTLIMVDGRLVFNYVYGGTLWESIPVSIIDIDRIEVVRGPAGALYGPNAVNGVINIITVEGKKGKPFDVAANTEFGNLNSKKAELSLNSCIKNKLNLRLSGNYSYIDRSQEEIYMWPFGEYKPVEFIDTINPWNPSGQIKPNPAVDYIPDPTLGTDRFGVNFYANYKINDNSNIRLVSGLQNSEIISSIIDDSYIAESRRGVKSKYADLAANIGQWKTQFSYTNGWMNASKGSEGFEFDYHVMQFKTEYDFVLWEKLHILPGVSFDQSVYDDTPYLGTENLLNGEKKIQYYAFNIRADYTFFDRLRLVGAFRTENYNHPKKNYFAHQIVSSFKINDNNIVRAVHSKSNTSPFMVDMYTNFDWKRVPKIEGYTAGLNLRFDGNTELDLITLNLTEIGYRFKPQKNVQVDLELFYSTTENLSALMPDSVHILFNDLGQPTNILYQPIDPTTYDFENNYPTMDYIHVQYENLDMTSTQFGFTANVDFMLGEKFRMKIFGTYQKTKLENYYPYTIDETVSLMTQSVYQIYRETGQITGGVRPTAKQDIDHNYTPDFYGGFVVYWKPTEKLTIVPSGYFYSEQEYIHKYETTTIPAKAIFSLKVDYKLFQNNSIYFNARNILNNNAVEFGFLDRNVGKYSVGLMVSF